MPEAKLPDFTDKVVLVQSNIPTVSWWLFSPTLENEGGKLFIVGKSLPNQERWPAGSRIGMPWDSVAYYFVFESLEVYQECQRASLISDPEAKSF
jgi:hypothetical protein